MKDICFLCMWTFCMFIKITLPPPKTIRKIDKILLPPSPLTLILDVIKRDIFPIL